jgi:hypothetical protein
VPRFWLTYRFPIGRAVRYPNGRAAGVVVLDAPDLLQAKFKAAVYGDDRGLEFASGHQLDTLSAEQIPADMIGRFLNQGGLRKLQRLLGKLQAMLLKKKPPAPSVRRRTAFRRKVGNHDPQGRNRSVPPSE